MKRVLQGRPADERRGRRERMRRREKVDDDIFSLMRKEIFFLLCLRERERWAEETGKMGF